MFCVLLFNVTSVLWRRDFFFIKRMANFKISAPGRIILCGEHAAMYGKYVIMAGLDLRTTLKFCELIETQGNIIKIEFPDVDLSLNVSLKEVLNFYSSDNFNEIISNSIRLLNVVQSLITLNGMSSTYAQRFSLQVVFFLLYYIAFREKLVIKFFHVHVSTKLPIGAGLGSSSSFAVCLAACFLHWARLQKGTHDAFSLQELSLISNIAMHCEEVMQDYEFGVENSVSSCGNILKFRCKYQDEGNDIILHADMPNMKIILIDSNIRHNKSERAKQMAMLKCFQPEFFDNALRRYDVISNGIYTMLCAIAVDHRNSYLLQLNNSYQSLQTCLRINQEILHFLGLSHPRIDTICSIAQKCGFGGKLTGFEGGFVYILFSPFIPEERITNLSTKLKEKGYDIMLTSVNCSGVRIDD